MKIYCENAEFEKDMQDLVNLFYAEEDCPFSVHHNSYFEGILCQSEISIDGNDKVWKKSFVIPLEFDDLKKKSLIKRNFKNHLYEVLSHISQKALPWGSLTGVRPTKFARDLVEKGEMKAHLISESLVKDYHISSEKARLVTQILKNQKCIIKNDKLIDLFINIPICPTRCNYCSFISNELKAVADKVDLYLDCVLKELEAVKKIISENCYIVRTIYI